MADEKNEKRHPIRVVARRTGLSPELVRIWEKRYGIVAPVRTPTGRRVYSDQDIERLRLVHRATLAGRRVGEVARLSPAELDALIREDERAALSALPSAGRAWTPGGGVASSEEPAPAAATQPTGVAFELVALFADQSLDAMRNLDAPRLEAILSQALVTLGPTAFVEELASPLLKTVGEQWAAGRIEPYHEHLVSALIRQTVTRLFTWQAADVSVPAVVVATPAGQRHEIGAILAASTAWTQGWRVIYLGADLPARNIAQATEQARASVVALSIVYPPDDPLLHAELKAMAHHLPKDVRVVAGGGAAGSYAQTLRQIGAEIAPDLKVFRSMLNSLRGD